jgi:TPR repeat protein
VATATRVFTKACDGGAAEACGHMAESLLKRDAPDVKRSASLFEKACNANDAHRCAELAALYELGLGVSMDPAIARKLRARACKMGYRPTCNEPAVAAH